MTKRVRIIIISAAVLIVLLVALTAVTWRDFGAKAATILSVREIDKYPVYVIQYLADYRFDEFLKHGTNENDMMEYLHQLLATESGSGEEFGPEPAWGCSVFVAGNEKGERIAGRNFDFSYSPQALVRTAPRDGFASVAIADISYLGYSKSRRPVKLQDRLPMIAAPYVCFDGLNEKGVFIALLAVPHAEPPVNSGKPTINTTAVIRLVLDYADSVSKALALISQYNIFFSEGIYCHYIVADNSGDSAVVEFVDGKMLVSRSKTKWQQVTNFILAEPGQPGQGQDRYSLLDESLRASVGKISEQEGMNLLEKVHFPKATQWSVVYNLGNGTFSLAIGSEYTKIYRFGLHMRLE